MEIFSLKSFIKTGRFGPIGIGSTKSDFITYFGNEYQIGDFGDTSIIKHADNWYEFFYWKETEMIYAIQIDHLEHEDSINFNTPNYKLDKWFLNAEKNVTFSEIQQILFDEKIDFIIEKQKYGFDIIKCVTSNVCFDFNDEVNAPIYTPNNRIKDYEIRKIVYQNDFILNGIRLFDGY